MDAADSRDLHTRTKQSLRYRVIRDLKLAAVRSGIRGPRRIGAFHQLFQFQKFAHESGIFSCPSFQHRSEIYKYLLDNFIGAEPIDYLEFGVFKGASLRLWVGLNTHPQSRFFGFDSFEGLPDKWDFFSGGSVEKGFFSTGSQVPDIDDARISYVKGFFQNSMRPFLKDFQRRNQLVLHLDADLYTSTLFVLSTMDEFIAPGTLLIFDEFGNVNDEFRAWTDYSTSFLRRARPVAWADGFYGVVAFQIEA